MAGILRQLPFFHTEPAALAPDGPVPVRPYQIIVWVSLSLPSVTELDAAAPRFPAILDTGNNHNLAIREEHLNRWTGLDLATLPGKGLIQVAGMRVALVAANVWIHPNRPGTRDEWEGPAFCLELEEGIAVYPRNLAAAVRLPLLGLRALVRNGLFFSVSGKKCQVSLRT
jgi:hypothetical protein